MKDVVRHPQRVWTEPEYEQEPLSRLRKEYLTYLSGRTKPASKATIRKYGQSLTSLIASIEQTGEAATLGALTPDAIGRWVGERRQRKLSEEGIASHLAVVKAFSRSYVYRHLELTTVDLLDKAPRLNVEPPAKQGLSEEEIERVFQALEANTFEDLRDRALLAVYLSTGLRFQEVLRMTEFDRVSGEFSVLGKGEKLRTVRMSPRALRFVRTYLRARPGHGAALWVTDRGEPLTYWGAQSIFRRLKRRTGITRLHAHLCRHTFGQTALRKGAERAAVQDMLGHETDVMTRRYTSTARAQTAAAMMPRYSPV